MGVGACGGVVACGVCGACVGTVGRESIARSALLSGYLGKSGHLPRCPIFIYYYARSLHCVLRLGQGCIVT